MASEIAIDLCDLPVVKSALFVTVVIRILLPPVTRSPRVGTKTRVRRVMEYFRSLQPPQDLTLAVDLD